MIKTVLITFSVTISAVILAFSIFMNAILGLFGLTATTIDALLELKRSAMIVEHMKTKHQQKKLKAPKKFATRMVGRVVSNSAAAFTIGTVAVIFVTATHETMQYCEEKKELNDEANILYGTEIVFDNYQCINEAKEESNTILSEMKNSSEAIVSSAFNSTAEYTAKQWDSIKSTMSNAAQPNRHETENIFESIKQRF